MNRYEEHEDRIEICPTKKTILGSNQIDYKFNEGNLLEEIKNYINSTYKQHYIKGSRQTLEDIADDGNSHGFIHGNLRKYSSRYGKKGTPDEWRKDLIKVIHYGILALYFHDLEINNQSVEKTPEQTSKL